MKAPALYMIMPTVVEAMRWMEGENDEEFDEWAGVDEDEDTWSVPDVSSFCQYQQMEAGQWLVLHGETATIEHHEDFIEKYVLVDSLEDE